MQSYYWARPVFSTTVWIDICYKESSLSHCKNSRRSCVAKENLNDGAYNAL